jgi:hypothetical protein
MRNSTLVASCALFVSCGTTDGDQPQVQAHVQDAADHGDARVGTNQPADAAAENIEQRPGDDASMGRDDASDANPAGNSSDGSMLVSHPVISNVVLWLDGSEGVDATDGRVAKWTDQSALHNDALQNTGSVRPLLVPAGPNGHPAVRFEASRKTVLLVSDAPSLHFGSGDLTIEVVVGYHNKSNGGMPVDHLDGWGYVFNKMVGNRLGVGLMGNWPTSETSPIGSQFGCETTEQGGSLLSKAMGYNDDKPRLWGMRRVGGTVELRRNGMVDNSGKWSPAVNVDAMGTPPISIGARLYEGQTNASFPLDGDIAEVVALKGTILPEQLATLESYLVDKYALAK